MAGYIGSKASVVSSGAERKTVITATSGQTSLTGLSYTPTQVHVFQNGVRLVDGTDYTATNGSSITLTVGASTNDQIVVVSYATVEISDAVPASSGGTFSGNVVVNGTVTANGLNGTVTANGLTVENSSLQIKFSENDGTNNPRLITYFDSSGTHLQHTWSSGASNLIFEVGGSEGSGTEVMRFNSLGRIFSPPTYSNTSGGSSNVGIGSSGEIYRSTSSRKYKNTINDATHGLAELLTLRPVTYKGNSDGDTIFGGLIAEEVHEAGLTEFVQYAEDGSPDALSYSNMVALCIKAIQEQQAKIETLETKVAALEAGE